MNILQLSPGLVRIGVFAFFSLSALLPATDRKNDNMLDAKHKSVQRLESNRTFGGYTKTSIFYTFPKQSVILRVVIDNQKEDFPSSAMLYTFADDVSEKGLKKWLNNQTSDALYADAPRPTSKKPLGDGTCKIKKSQHIKDVQGRTGQFGQHKVEFEIIKMGMVAGFKIKTFQDNATVYLKLK